MFQHDYNHTGVTNGTAPETNHCLWSSSAGFWLESSPAVSDGKVFIGSEDGNVYCFDAFTGAKLWSFPTAQLIVCSPAVSNGKVYIGSFNNHVYCLNENTGDLIWDYATGWSIAQSSPAVYHGKVYIGSQDNKLYCLDAEKGTKLWDFTTDYYISSSPAVVSDRVYFGGFDGHLRCLDANTGKEIWDNNITYTIWTSSPTLYESRLYIGALDFEVHCFDSMNGLQIWNFTTGDFVTGTPAAYEGNIYIGSWDNTLYCLNATTGAVVWTYLTGGPVSDSAAICDGKVYFGSSDNKTYCLDAETGKELWEYTTGGQILSSPAIANGNVYIGSLDYNVYCFGGENQNPSANFTWTPPDPSPSHAIFFDASSSYDPDGYITSYEWDWDNDGIFEEVSSAPTATHAWSNPGAYPVSLRVTDNDSASGTMTKTVVVRNQPPDTPIIQGPASGKTGHMLNYSITSTDPDGDSLSYYVDWGDGSTSGWIGPYPSGDAVTLSHTWTLKGTYTMKAKARDIYGNESGWGILKVTMPLSYESPHFRLLAWLLERFPHACPFLRYLLRI
jgi:outer membrane protein assembly factor BamB